MHKGDLTWLIGGPQGGGIDTSGLVFARYANRCGLRVFSNIEYHSNIMGEHSYYRVRIASKDRHSILDQVNVVVALDEETLIGDPHADFTSFKGHLQELVPSGVAVYDSAGKFKPSEATRSDITLLGVPLMDLLKEALRGIGREGDANRLRIMTNTIALGASVFAMGGDIELFAQVYRDDFKGARAELGEMNALAANAGYEYAAQQLGGRSPFDMKAIEAAVSNGHATGPSLLIRGMHACAFGKLKAGLHIQTYYPISPATDESVYLEANQRDQNLLVVQCEDEIASIQMAVGAANAGARSSTSTSGPGFALMVEGIGYASLTEVPGPVVFLWQRGGPSTGLPTRQDQGDLRFALHPAQGDFPHILVAPADPQQIFDDSFEAFNWADRYQMPVVVLVDKYLSTQSASLDELKMENLVIDRGSRYRSNGRANGAGDEYLRFAFTENGVSPRSFPGEEGGIFWSTSDEHDPRGHITEDAENRILMMEKRMGKLDLAASEIPGGRKISVYGPADADVTLVGWGSVKGSVLDAIELLAEEDGVRASFVQIRLLKPFPVEEVTAALSNAKRLILVENNYTGQLGGLVREMTGIHIPQKVLKYDGRPFSEEELVEGLRKALATGDARVHVSHLSA
ncbi:MAG: 2:oxoacid-ferredoxin oxidoreductase, fused alpha and gamma subunit [Chloroflexi bacterium]|nr:2:oxoacid-ferredoxin oxidoreductase, fused alpha and gamma subunit [Chloroflexota bacterium]